MCRFGLSRLSGFSTTVFLSVHVPTIPENLPDGWGFFERSCQDGVQVKDEWNACSACRGCKSLSGKGKEGLFTELSTENGDKVAAGTRWRLRQEGRPGKCRGFFSRVWLFFFA